MWVGYFALIFHQPQQNFDRLFFGLVLIVPNVTMCSAPYVALLGFRQKMRAKTYWRI